jgi:hypothetical protein
VTIRAVHGRAAPSLLEDGRAVQATMMIQSGQRFEIRYNVPLIDQNDPRDT